MHNIGWVNHIKILVLVVLSTLPISKGLFGSTSGAPSGRDSLEAMDIKKSPNTQDWRAFFKNGPELRQRLWSYHQTRGRNLSDWAWEWRLAWLRSCSTSTLMYCGKIMGDSLSDEALVVRAEAASLIGDRYMGTGYKKALRILENAYHNPNNFRNKKPLWVQFRILEAINKIGGSDAQEIATRLSRNSDRTASYWKKINKF